MPDADCVLAEAIGVSIVSVAILLFAYGAVKRAVVGWDDWLIQSNVRLAVFIGVLFILPVTLLLSGLLVTS